MHLQTSLISTLATRGTAASSASPAISTERFDTTGDEISDDSQIHTEPIARLLTGTPRRLEEVPASEDELLAVKTAQLVARHLAESAHAAMAGLGSEFSPAAFSVEAARSAALHMAPVLQPLAPHKRRSIVERAVDPDDCSEALDVVLDRVGSILSVYASRLPGPNWTPLPPTREGCFADGLMTWQIGDHSIVLDLLDGSGPAGDAERHGFEVAEALRTGSKLFGTALRGVRYLPAHAMSEERFCLAPSDDGTSTPHATGAAA